MRRAAVLGVVGLWAATAASAQTLPAEYPPATFTGPQYVDSTGCVFVRTGSGPLTDWVPRLTRSREHICGQTPSLGAQATAPAPAPVATPAVLPGPKVAQATVPVTTHRAAPAPGGYRPAWADDRLNPRRAVGTPEGEAAMNRKWTQEVPRRLVSGG